MIYHSNPQANLLLTRVNQKLIAEAREKRRLQNRPDYADVRYVLNEVMGRLLLALAVIIGLSETALFLPFESLIVSINALRQFPIYAIAAVTIIYASVLGTLMLLDRR